MSGPTQALSRHRTVLIIFAVALVLRLIVVFALPHYRPLTDSADYDRQAVSLVSHGSFPNSLLPATSGPTAFRPPMFPLALAGVYELSGTGSASARWRAGLIAEAALGALAVALTWSIAVLLFGPVVGWTAGLVAACYPPLILVGSSLMSEPLFISLVLGAVLAALRARSSPRRLWWCALAGVLAGLAALTRSVGIIIVVALVPLVWHQRPRLSGDSVLATLALVGALVVTMIPWTVRNETVLHAFVPVSTEDGFALAGTYSAATRSRRDFTALWGPPVVQYAEIVKRHPGLNEAEISSRLTSGAVNYATANPGYVGTVVFWSAVRLLNLEGPAVERYLGRYEVYPRTLTDVSVYVFWPIALIAVLGAGTRMARRAPAAFWAVPALLMVATLFFSGGTRYRSPADPFIVILAALGAHAVYRRLRLSTPRTQRLPSATG